MEQMLTFSNVVLIVIFVSILALIIGFSIYALNKDEGDNDLSDSHQESLKKEVEEIWKPGKTAIRTFGETECRINSKNLPVMPLDDTEYRLRRLQLLNAEAPAGMETCFHILASDQSSSDHGSTRENDARPCSTD